VGGDIDILLVDDQLLVRGALAHLLSAQQGLRVVGEAADVTEAAALCSRLKPDVLLTNLDSPVFEDDGALNELINCAEAARVLVLMSVSDPQAHARTIAVGVVGLVDKRQEPGVLFKAIRKVHAGELWLARYDMASVLRGIVRLRTEDAREAEKITTLTKREREIIQLIALGLRNRQIGERLFISEATVRNHVSSILDKLSLSDRLELVLYAFSLGLAKTPKAWHIDRAREHSAAQHRDSGPLNVGRRRRARQA
jgi:DNA-binding NarL/FixJ family response regulator